GAPAPREPEVIETPKIVQILCELSVLCGEAKTFSVLKLSRCLPPSLPASQLYVDRSHRPVLAPATQLHCHLLARFRSRLVLSRKSHFLDSCVPDSILKPCQRSSGIFWVTARLEQA